MTNGREDNLVPDIRRRLGDFRRHRKITNLEKNYAQNSILKN
jgi:hypothetical protein